MVDGLPEMESLFEVVEEAVTSVVGDGVTEGEPLESDECELDSLPLDIVVVADLSWVWDGLTEAEGLLEMVGESLIVKEEDKLILGVHVREREAMVRVGSTVNDADRLGSSEGDTVTLSSVDALPSVALREIDGEMERLGDRDDVTLALIVCDGVDVTVPLSEPDKLLESDSVIERSGVGLPSDIETDSDIDTLRVAVGDTDVLSDGL